MGGKPVVLVVEDDISCRRLLKKALQENYQVYQAADGIEALILSGELIPDLVISDGAMPRMNGYELCTRLRSGEATRSIPVILLVEKPEAGTALVDSYAAADAYLGKPFPIAELKRCCAQALRFADPCVLNHEAVTGPRRPRNRTFVKRASRCVKEHMHRRDFSVEWLASELGISRRHLHRRLSALTGETPSRFIRSVRMECAAEFLLKGRKSVRDAALAVGYSSTGYFRKMFRDRFGVDPTVYAGETLSK